MALPETGPTSSYSDPIYDRIDTFAQALRRRWWIYTIALLAIVAIAQVARLQLTNRPEEASATAFNAALNAKPEERLPKLRDLANDAKASSYYRARAGIELVQDRLEHDDAPAGKEYAEKAMKLADESKDVELQYAARLSRAAVAFQLGELDAAAADYARVESAGARYAAQQLEATLGSAATLAKQGKRDEAIAKLEPLLTRSDAGAETLLDLARVRYWQLRREQAEAAAGAQPAASGAQPTATVAPAAPTIQGPPAPEAPAQPAPATTAPAAPAATAQPVPTAPASK